MPNPAQITARIAEAQLAGLGRVRTVLHAPPFTALLTPGGPGHSNYAVAQTPGKPVDDLGDSLDVLRAAFAPLQLRFELIDEASPGAVDALLAAGLTAIGRYPLLVLDTAGLIMPATPAGATVRVGESKRDTVDAKSVADVAFGMATDKEPDAPGEAAGGGCVVARMDGRPVACAYWVAVADGVTEIAGVATHPEYRKRGLGTLVTAAAVRAATERAGVSLAWLTPGHDGADRIYRSVGFTPMATAVHLS